VREYESTMILDAIERSGGNQRAAARLLQIPLRTLTSKLELYALRDRIKPKSR
jgi:DNA-binding NtrC family response regulator